MSPSVSPFCFAENPSMIPQDKDALFYVNQCFYLWQGRAHLWPDLIWGRRGIDNILFHTQHLLAGTAALVLLWAVWVAVTAGSFFVKFDI